MQALEAHGKAPRRRRPWLVGFGAVLLVIAAAAVAYGLGKSSSDGHKSGGGHRHHPSETGGAPFHCRHLARGGDADGGFER